jgi:ParB-like chromosome segregation protein Spo0J
MPGMMFNVTRSPDELKPHPENTDIYGNEEVDNDLVESIKEKGILEPIVIKDDGTILSGHRRWTAAKEAKLDKVPCRTITFNDGFDEIESLIEFNRQRKKTDYQLGKEAKRLYEIQSEKARQRQVEAGEKGKEGGRGNKKEKTLVPISEQGFSSEPSPKTIETVGNTLGMGKNKVSQLIYVTNLADKEEEEEDNGVKEKINEFKTGKITANKAYREIKIAKKKSNEKKVREELIKKLEGKQGNSFVTLEHGDFYELTKNIPDNSIDCVITDPPYPYEFIECWNKLSEVANRVLKPSGFCIVYTGHIHLPEVMERMRRHLKYYWLCTVSHTGHKSNVPGRNMIANFKPILIYQKEPFLKTPSYINDVFTGKGREKDGHEWQQAIGESIEIIEKFTKPGDTILEPFSGSGTVPAACIQTKRYCKAYEIDKESYEKSLIRIFEGK